MSRWMAWPIGCRGGSTWPRSYWNSSVRFRKEKKKKMFFNGRYKSMASSTTHRLSFTSDSNRFIGSSSSDLRASIQFFFGAISKLELNLTDGSLRCQWTPFADWIRNSWRGGGAGERITHYSLIQMLELELNFDVSISNGIDDGLRCSQLWIISKILA